MERKVEFANQALDRRKQVLDIHVDAARGYRHDLSPISKYYTLIPRTRR